MLVLRWLWEGFGYGLVDPSVVFWTLRFVMFVLSLVLEDWAVHELFDSPHERRVAVLLVASSYVTWTWQTHTFSNSIETLLVLWSLVLIKRILHNEVQLHARHRISKDMLTDILVTTPRYSGACHIEFCISLRNFQPRHFPSVFACS